MLSLVLVHVQIDYLFLSLSDALYKEGIWSVSKSQADRFEYPQTSREVLRCVLTLAYHPLRQGPLTFTFQNEARSLHSFY